MESPEKIEDSRKDQEKQERRQKRELRKKIPPKESKQMRINLDRNIETETRKIDEKIKKLQEKKSQLAEKLKTEKQQLDLARRVGVLILQEFQGKSFEYQELLAVFDKNLVLDFDREFFSLKPLPADNKNKPKTRGRKKN
ncbi:MAG: hypothetical protein LBJ14_08170 [Desulfarculales bacterium]|jgi:hypothetical protein|nr:hypothetical protein [Desulfarculales bacterium]